MPARPLAAPPPPGPPLEVVATDLGLRIDLAAFTARLKGPRQLARFLGALTVSERRQPGRPYAPAKRTAYRKLGAHLYVPHAKGALFTAPPLAATLVPRPAAAVRPVTPERLRPAGGLYPYQAAAVDHVCGPDGQGGVKAAYLQIGTGLGKSRLAMAIAARVGGPAFVVVPTKAIRSQWLDEVAAMYPGLRSAAYDNVPAGGRRAPPGPGTHDFVVGIINTVRAKPAGFFAGYALVIIDEAHETSSPANLQVLWLAQGAPRLLGLSASPADRADGLDRVVYHFFEGGVIDAAADIPGFDVAGVHFRARVREVEYAGHPDHCVAAVSAAGTLCAIETVGNIIRDPARMRLVVAEVARLYAAHTAPDAAEFGLGPRPAADATAAHPAGGVRTHGVFVFAEHRDYLPLLRAALLEHFAPEDLAVPELDAPGPGGGDMDPGGGDMDDAADDHQAVVLRGGATRETLAQAHRARIVLTTYGYSRRGVSIVEMTSIVLATPRRHGLRQIVGRIRRRGSDESILRVVVDIKDVRTALKGQSTERRKTYKEHLYPIYRVRVDHTAYAVPPYPPAPATGTEECVWEPPAGAEPGDVPAAAEDADGAPGHDLADVLE